MSMGSGVIETRLREMRRSAERIEEIHCALVREVTELKDSIRRLELEWDGGANSAFMIAVEADLTEIYVLLSLIWDAGRLLERAECSYQGTEREVKEVMERICKLENG